jgi:hypothetical protein
MKDYRRIAPIFPVRDLERALQHYASLGFETRAYEDSGYGFVTRDQVEIHLGLVPDPSNFHPASAYLFVADADAVTLAWTDAGADVRPPEDTEWGQHEGVLIDLDGNIIRFGSPLRRRAADDV